MALHAWRACRVSHWASSVVVWVRQMAHIRAGTSCLTETGTLQVCAVVDQDPQLQRLSSGQVQQHGSILCLVGPGAMLHVRQSASHTAGQLQPDKTQPPGCNTASAGHQADLVCPAAYPSHLSKTLYPEPACCAVRQASLSCAQASTPWRSWGWRGQRRGGCAWSARPPGGCRKLRRQLRAPSPRES